MFLKQTGKNLMKINLEKSKRLLPMNKVENGKENHPDFFFLKAKNTKLPQCY